MEKWEYLTSALYFKEYYDPGRGQWMDAMYWDGNETDQMTVQERFEKLGREGWKAVSAYPATYEEGTTIARDISWVTYIFTRPVHN